MIVNNSLKLLFQALCNSVAIVCMYNGLKEAIISQDFTPSAAATLLAAFGKSLVPLCAVLMVPLISDERCPTSDVALPNICHLGLYLCKTTSTFSDS